MILLNMKIDNICMFNNFEIDFTIDRLQGESIVGNERIKCAPKIKYKKLNIIMGGNATGKTTFGKVICEMENLLLGRPSSIIKKIYDKKKNSRCEILFVEGKYLFNYLLEVKQDQYIEKLKYTKLRKSKNLDSHKKYLEKEPSIETYNNVYSFEKDKVIISKVIDSFFEEEKSDFKLFFIKNFAYYFRFASFTENSINPNISDELLKETEKILKIIDNSIDSIRTIESTSLNNKDNDSIKEDDYYIVFKNGERVLVKESNPKNIKDNRLSQGTIEAIEMSYILKNLNSFPGTVYLDEQMAYMHTELSNNLILKLIESNKDSQIFITTHNENVLDLNVPIHSYTFFTRNDGVIDVVNPEKKLNKNDRNLKLYVQNNYFETYPELDDLWRNLDE